MKIHHIGILVNNIEESRKFYQLFSFKPEGSPVTIPDRGIKVQFLYSLAGDMYHGKVIHRIELIEPLRDDVDLPMIHLAFYENSGAGWNRIVQEASKLNQKGDTGWQIIPELKCSVAFFNGPNGELLELVKNDNRSH